MEASLPLAVWLTCQLGLVLAQPLQLAWTGNDGKELVGQRLSPIVALLMLVSSSLMLIGCLGCRGSKKKYTGADSSAPPQPQQDNWKDLANGRTKNAAATMAQLKRHKFTLSPGFKLEKKIANMKVSGRFVAEYTDIEQSEKLFPQEDRLTLAALKPENIALNRYSNVLAKDATRVVLTTGPRDYINANYVKGYEGDVNFICTQGPLEATVEDFWRMVWEQNSCLIVMTTKLIEGDKDKCASYWPQQGGKATYGMFEIFCDGHVTSSAAADKSWCVRELTVRNTEHAGTRTVHQYQYDHWPDHGIPESAAQLFALLDDVNARQRALGPGAGPIVVHCSAGIGRSGTIIACDTAAKMLRATESIDIYNIVLELRRAREGMIQTSAQYRFCYEAALLYWNIMQQEKATAACTNQHTQNPDLSAHTLDQNSRNPDLPLYANAIQTLSGLSATAPCAKNEKRPERHVLRPSQEMRTSLVVENEIDDGNASDSHYINLPQMGNRNVVSPPEPMYTNLK